MFDAWTILLLVWIGLGKFAAIAAITRLSRIDRYRQRRVYRGEPADPEQLRRERGSAVLLVSDALALGLCIHLGWLRLGDNSAVNVVTTFAILFVGIEIWFYFSHRALHGSQYLWRFHEHHHQSVLVQPLSAASFSIVEKLVFYTLPWVALTTAMSWFLSVSLVGVTMYYSFYYLMSTVAHSNVEFFPAEIAKLPLGLGRQFNCPSGHALHHARSRGNYGFLTSTLDRLLGTHFADTDTIFLESARKRGPRDLPRNTSHGSSGATSGSAMTIEHCRGDAS